MRPTLAYTDKSGNVTYYNLMSKDGEFLPSIQSQINTISSDLSSHTHSYLPLSGGTLTGILTTTGVRPTVANTSSLGTSSLPYKYLYANGIYASINSTTYGNFYVAKEGTTSENGIGQISLGNEVVSFTANNAIGRIRLYGTSSGYTWIVAGRNTTGNNTITLPTSTGTLALSSEFDSYLPLAGGTLTGTVYTKFLAPDVNDTEQVGSTTYAYNSMLANNFYVQKNSKQYGRFYAGTVGTTTEVGRTTLLIGNATAEGTADNAEGRITMYGTGTYYTHIKTGSIGSNVTLTLPTTGGNIPVASLSGTTLTLKW